MAVVRLSKGYNISESRRSGSNRMRIIRWAFLCFSCFVIISVILAIGYLSRLNFNQSYNKRGPAKERQSEQQIKPQNEEEVDYLYYHLPKPGEGLEFNGRNYYDIPSVYESSKGSIAFWFMYPELKSKTNVYLAGNRDIICTGSDCNGYAIYVDTNVNKIHLVWKNKGNVNHDELITSGRIRVGRWNHIVVNFSRPKKGLDEGSYLTTMEVYINNALAFLRREERYPAGARLFSLGASPSHTHNLKGRIYNVMIGKTAFTESQIATIYLNNKNSIKQLYSLCYGTYLLKAENLPEVEEESIAELEAREEQKQVEEELEEEKEEKPESSQEVLQKEEEISKEDVSEEEETKEEPVKEEEKEMVDEGKQEKETLDEDEKSEKSEKIEKTEESEKSEQNTTSEEIQEESTNAAPSVSRYPHPKDLLANYINRPSFVPTKLKPGSLRSESAASIRPPPEERDDLCSLIPPAPIPVVSGTLERFINTLISTPADDVKEGNFHFSVPEDLYDDYHYLNEYRAKNVRDAFCFGWAGYKQFAWGADEVHPISGGRGDNWGGFGMTILDSMDTLELLGLHKEFAEATKWVREQSNFDRDFSVSVFETNIRIVGGMIAAYDFTNNTLFLDKAVDMANRLLPAFKTVSGYPKSSVNLRTGFAMTPQWTGNNVLLAEIGTMSLEFLYLAKHTGNDVYKTTIDKIYSTLKRIPTSDGLLPTFLSPATGEPRGGTYSMGASADSHYEYLLKMWIQGGKKDEAIRKMYNKAVDGMTKRLLRRSSTGLLYCGEETKGRLKAEMGHLTCFVGGMLALGVLHGVNPETAERDLANAKALGYTCYRMYKDSPTGISGETMLFTKGDPFVHFQSTYYILRPEAIETLYYLNHITGDPIYREWGWEMWQAVEKTCRVHYGYCHLSDVRNEASKEDRAESFFYAETVKYAYLLFKDDKIVDLTKKVFTTEAHPLTVF